MTRTGVKATPEEVTDLRRLARAGWMPGDVMIVSSILEGITRDQKTLDACRVCHQLALAHGLPEIPGYYGLTEDGEFVTWG